MADEPSNTKTRKMFRFKLHHDIQLMIEVICVKPNSSNKRGWDIVADNFNANFDAWIDGRRARERTELLVVHFKSEDYKNLKKSGTDEQLTELTTLLQDWVDLQESFPAKSSKTAKENKEASDKEKAKKIRQASLEGKSPAAADGPSPAGKKRKSHGSDVVEYLQQKNESQMKLKEEENSIARQRLDFEREKFNLEKQERLAHLEIMKSLATKK